MPVPPATNPRSLQRFREYSSPWNRRGVLILTIAVSPTSSPTLFKHQVMGQHIGIYKHRRAQK